jgi:glycosyltransferase involved in cell wall biosynthesis
MDYEPNVEAATYLVKEIFPLIRRLRPNCSLSIMGKEPPLEVCRFSEIPGVTVAGDVPDVKPYYRRTSVAVVPIKSGGGTRLKILESMALGTPVVATPIGCEGLEVEDGRHILVADKPEVFAAQVDRLLTQPVLWERLAREGRRLVEECYNWRHITELYRHSLERLAGI